MRSGSSSRRRACSQPWTTRLVTRWRYARGLASCAMHVAMTERIAAVRSPPSSSHAKCQFVRPRTSRRSSRSRRLLVASTFPSSSCAPGSTTSSPSHRPRTPLGRALGYVDRQAPAHPLVTGSLFLSTTVTVRVVVAGARVWPCRPASPSLPPLRLQASELCGLHRSVAAHSLPAVS